MPGMKQAAQDSLRDSSHLTQAVARAIKTLRHSQSLTQDQLADRADLDRSHISQLERGLRMPALDTLVRIAGGLNLSFVMLAQAIEDEFGANSRAAAGEPVSPLSLPQLSAKPGRPGRRLSK